MIAPSRNDFRSLAYALDPVAYARSLGIEPFGWQEPILLSQHHRKGINAARQAGKSTIVSVKASHCARFQPGSLALVLAATEKQAQIDMEKITAFMASDAQYPKLLRQSDELIELANGSRLKVVTASEKSARGHSKPRLVILDEASRIDEVVVTAAILPMLTDNPDCEVIALSTPNGPNGYFYRLMHSKRWERYVVRSPFEPFGNLRLRAAQPEEAFREAMRELGIAGSYSPRHRNLDEQLEMLEEMQSARLYRQEVCCEFVEAQDAVWQLPEIDTVMQPSDIEALDHDLTESDIGALSL